MYETTLLGLPSHPPTPTSSCFPSVSFFTSNKSYIGSLIIFFRIDVGRYYGGGAKYKSVWDRMNLINKNAKSLKAAVDAGLDPITVDLIDAEAGKSKNQGSGCSLLSIPLSIALPLAHFTISFCLQLQIRLLIFGRHVEEIWWRLHLFST
jgi:hypothetical protein